MKRADGPLSVCNTAQSIVGGMSGSPVISDTGAAIGIVAASKCQGCEDQYGTKNPRLMRDLPGWLLHAQSSKATTILSEFHDDVITVISFRIKIEFGGLTITLSQLEVAYDPWAGPGPVRGVLLSLRKIQAYTTHARRKVH